MSTTRRVPKKVWHPKVPKLQQTRQQNLRCCFPKNAGHIFIGKPYGLSWVYHMLSILWTILSMINHDKPMDNQDLPWFFGFTARTSKWAKRWRASIRREKPWTMGRSWEDHGKIMGKPWENHGKMVIYMENHHVEWENTSLLFRICRKLLVYPILLLNLYHISYTITRSKIPLQSCICFFTISYSTLPILIGHSQI